MQKRKLGRSGLEVSEIAFGGVEIGMPYGIGVESEKDMLSEKEAVSLLQEATNLGINFFDTARSYGKSETIMGKAFKRMRNKVIINTKCVPLPLDNDLLTNKNKIKKIIDDSLRESLKALQTDYIDVFMLHHSGDNILANQVIAEIFTELKASGMIRATGTSVYHLEETKMALDSGVWDVIQLPFNLLDQRQKEYFDLAKHKQVGMVVRSVLFKGLLSDRGKNLHPALKKVESHIDSYSQLFDETIHDLPTLATKFALSFQEVSSVLVGIDKMSYLKKTLQIADGKYFDKDKLKQSEKLAFPDPAFLNLPYWDKMGWLK